MTFEEMLTQVVEVLRRERRVSYRALRRRFGLDGRFGQTGLPRQAGVGGEFILTLNFPCRRNNDKLFQRFGEVQIEAYVRASVGDTCCEIGTV